MVGSAVRLDRAPIAFPEPPPGGGAPIRKNNHTLSWGLEMNRVEILRELGVEAGRGDHAVHSPVDGAEIGRVALADAPAIEQKIANSLEA